MRVSDIRTMTSVIFARDDFAMPIRQTRPRKSDGLRQYIDKLYRDPMLKYFGHFEEWGPISDLIYGPGNLYTDKFFDEDVRQQGFKRLASLKELWGELREDILKAQAQYQPKDKPWGVRFDKGRRRGKN